MRLKISTPVIFLLAIIASSCAPSRMFIRTSGVCENQISRSERMGIINDVCLETAPLLDEYCVLLDDSKIAAIFMAEEAKVTLERKGYKIDYIFSPFVGSFLRPDDSVRVADEKGGRTRNLIPPLFVDESLANDIEYANALIKVFDEVNFTVGQNKEPIFASNDELRNSLQIISNRTGNDKILFITGNGSVTPIGKLIIEGITYGLFSALLGNGTLNYSIYDSSFLNSNIALIDLNTGEMLWANSKMLSGNDPSRESFYSDKWSRELLYHFPLHKGKGP